METTERPMRRKDREVTDTVAIHAVLGRATVCRIAMVDGTEPYVVPMNCGWDGTELFLHAATSGRKLDILRANPRVCIEVEEDVRIVTGSTGEECTSHYRTVIGTGTAVFLDDPPGKSHGLNVILRQCHPGVPDEIFPASALNRIVVLKIHFDHLTCKANPV